jgi:hypothetical protein
LILKLFSGFPLSIIYPINRAFEIVAYDEGDVGLIKSEISRG